MAAGQEETLPTADAAVPGAAAVHDGAGVGLEQAQQVPILDTDRSFADSALQSLLESYQRQSELTREVMDHMVRGKGKGERRTPAQLEVPSWDGSPESFNQYKYAITNMRALMATSDLDTTVHRLAVKLTGKAKTAVVHRELDLKSFNNPDTGYEEFLVWIRRAVGIEEHEEENKHFNHYFNVIRRVRNHETMQDWAQKESMAMLRLQEALQLSVDKQTGSDTDDNEDGPSAVTQNRPRRQFSFKLPRRLRGWLYLM